MFLTRSRKRLNLLSAGLGNILVLIHRCRAVSKSSLIDERCQLEHLFLHYNSRRGVGQSGRQRKTLHRAVPIQGGILAMWRRVVPSGK